MIEVKEFQCDKSTPSTEEIKEAIKIANEHNCIARLRWFYPYSGYYSLDVKSGMTLEQCEDALPKVYPV